MWFIEIAICFSPLQPNCVDNAVKEFTKNSKRSKEAIQPSSLAFLIFFSNAFHWSLSHLKCSEYLWFFYFIFFHSVSGNSGVCIPKADETMPKSSYNWQISKVHVFISLPLDQICGHTLYLSFAFSLFYVSHMVTTNEFKVSEETILLSDAVPPNRASVLTFNMNLKCVFLIFTSYGCFTSLVFTTDGCFVCWREMNLQHI